MDCCTPIGLLFIGADVIGRLLDKFWPAPDLHIAINHPFSYLGFSQYRFSTFLTCSFLIPCSHAVLTRSFRELLSLFFRLTWIRPSSLSSLPSVSPQLIVSLVLFHFGRLCRLVVARCYHTVCVKAPSFKVLFARCPVLDIVGGSLATHTTDIRRILKHCHLFQSIFDNCTP